MARERDNGVYYRALPHSALGALIVAGALEANFSCTGPPDHVAVQIGKSVAFHHVWRGIPLIVTLLGWGWTVKGLLYLIYPKHGLRMLARVSLEKSHEFVIAGVVLLLLCGLIASSLALRGALVE